MIKLFNIEQTFKILTVWAQSAGPWTHWGPAHFLGEVQAVVGTLGVGLALLTPDRGHHSPPEWGKDKGPPGAPCLQTQSHWWVNPPGGAHSSSGNVVSARPQDTCADVCSVGRREPQIPSTPRRASLTNQPEKRGTAGGKQAAATAPDLPNSDCPGVKSFSIPRVARGGCRFGESS